MKRFSVFLILFLYSILSSGVNIKIHYFGGEFESFSIWGDIDESSCCGEEMENDSCCKNKLAHFIVKEDQQENDLLTVSISNFSTETIIYHQPYSFCFERIYSSETIFFQDLPPPEKSDQPLYLINRILLI